MTVTGNQHRLLVDMILGFLRDGREYDAHTILREAAKIAPEGNGDDLKRAQEDASGIWLEQIEIDEAEVAAMERLMPLFDGMPEGMGIEQCALLKARRGDPLAIEYCHAAGIEIA